MVLAVAAVARPIAELHDYSINYSIDLGLDQSMHASGHMIVIINWLNEVSCSDFGVVWAPGLAPRWRTVVRK